MNFKPVSNQVLVSVIEENQTKSGLYIPTQEGSILKGYVEAVGEGAVNMAGEIIPMEVMLQNTILFDKRKAQSVDIEGKSYFILRETDVLGFFR